MSIITMKTSREIDRRTRETWMALGVVALLWLGFAAGYSRAASSCVGASEMGARP